MEGFIIIRYGLIILCLLLVWRKKMKILWKILICVSVCILIGDMFVLCEFGSWVIVFDGYEKLWDVERDVELYNGILWVIKLCSF